MQKHGADIYQKSGAKSKLLDFSNTVVEVPPPAGWQKQLSRHLGSLRHYPQPFGTGLAMHIESRYRLKAGSVLVGNGSSECLSWIAQSQRGKRVLVEAPCFGEYAVWLTRADADFRELGADEPYSPDWPRLKEAMKGVHAFWTANPSNPAGLELSLKEFKERLAWCRQHKVLLVLDEALHAQSLKSKGDQLLKLCVAEPGALVVRSLSKGLGLPGLRLGWVAGHPTEIAKLGAYVDWWTVNSLAQSAGAWILDTERRLHASRTKTLSAWSKDLKARIQGLPKSSLYLRESDSGFFLCRLLGKLHDSRVLASRLRKQGLLVRSCASYGGWGIGHIRLNPRSPIENARLEKALKRIYAAL